MIGVLYETIRFFLNEIRLILFIVLSATAVLNILIETF